MKIHYKTIKIDNALINVLDTDDSNTENPRLLIQGLGCEAKTIWTPLLTKLHSIGDNRRHIAFDVRGVGRSTGWPDSIKQITDDATQILSILKINSVEVVGHSLGGAIAILFAARYPKLVKSLALMDSIPRYSDESRSGFRWRVEQIHATNNIGQILDVVLPRSFGTETKTRRPNVIEKFRLMLSSQSPSVYTQLCELTATVDVSDELKMIKVPMLFVVGEEDLATTPEVIRSVATNISADFAIIPNAGHNPPLEQPLSVAKVIKEYSERHPVWVKKEH